MDHVLRRNERYTIQSRAAMSTQTVPPSHRQRWWLVRAGNAQHIGFTPGRSGRNRVDTDSKDGTKNAPFLFRSEHVLLTSPFARLLGDSSSLFFKCLPIVR